MGSTGYVYRCTILRWLDGDTVKVAIDLGFGITRTDEVRLYGVNAYEMHDKDPVLRAKAQAGLQMMQWLFPPNAEVEIVSHKPDQPTEKYGRWLAEVNYKGQSAAKALLDANLAVVYLP